MEKYLFSNENFQDSLIWRRLTLQKSVPPKSHQQKRPTAKMLKDFGKEIGKDFGKEKTACHR